MSYLIIGENSLVTKEINKLIEKNNIDINSIIKYDLFINSLGDVIEDLNTISLFNTTKCIIVFNIEKIQDITILEDYLNHQGSNLLIFTCSSKTENKLIYNLFNKNDYVINIEDVDLNNYIKEELKEYKISTLDINYLIDRCNNNYDCVVTELEKLKMYKLEEKEITQEDIKLLIKKAFDNNIFDLIDAIDHNNKKDMYSIFNELTKNNEPPIKILVTLANNYRLLYGVKELINDKNDDEIMKILDLKKPGRLYFLKKKTYNYTKDKLLEMIKDLSEVDIAIKSGKVEEKTAMELFFAKL